MYVKGSNISSNVGAFILRILHEYPDIKENRQNYLFYMDNSSLHTGELLGELWKKV